MKPSLSQNQNILEACYQKVKPDGRYQWAVFILMLVEFLVSNFMMVSGTFFYVTPKVLCDVDGSLTPCTLKQACDDAKQDAYKVVLDPSDYQNTLTTDFRLFCDRDALKSAASSIIFVGCFIGTLVAGYTSEKYGRRWTLIAGWVVMTFGSVLLASAYTIGQVMAGLFFGGMGLYPCNTVSFVILSEQSTGRFRAVTTGFALVGYSFTEFLIAGIAYACNNSWRQISIYAIAVPAIVFLAPNFFLIESPRYYLARGDKELAAASFTRMAAANRLDGVTFTPEHDLGAYEIVHEKGHTFTDLWHFKSVRSQVLGASFMKFVMMLGLYASNFALSGIGLSIYVNELFVAIGDTLPYILYAFIIAKASRRMLVGVGVALYSLILITFLAYPLPGGDACDDSCWQMYVQLAMFCTARFFSSLYFVVISMYFPEIFPTAVRGLATMVIRAVGVSGSILSSYVSFGLQSVLKPSGVIAALGAINLLAGAPLVVLRETVNKPLQDQISELRERGDARNGDYDDENSQSDSQKPLIRGDESVFSGGSYVQASTEKGVPSDD